MYTGNANSRLFAKHTWHTESWRLVECSKDAESQPQYQLLVICALLSFTEKKQLANTMKRKYSRYYYR